jgi:hypothetical protein
LEPRRSLLHGALISTLIVGLPSLVSGRIIALVSAGVSQAQTDERGIYQAVIEDMFRRKVPTALVVTTPPLAMRVPETGHWQQLGAAARRMKSKVEAQAAQPRSATFRVEWFPSGTRLVPSEGIEELRRTAPRGRTPEDAWIPFRTLFGVQTYQSFSLPVVSNDQRSALVWYVHSCGSLCGSDGFAFLQRGSRTAAWTVVKRVITTVS